jgi:hypothetical protein
MSNPNVVPNRHRIPMNVRLQTTIMESSIHIRGHIRDRMITSVDPHAWAELAIVSDLYRPLKNAVHSNCSSPTHRETGSRERGSAPDRVLPPESDVIQAVNIATSDYITGVIGGKAGARFE